MYAKGENYKWEGDHGRIASSIPPLSRTPLALTELGLLKEQEEQCCSTGKGRSATEGAQAQPGAASSPEGHSPTAPQLGKQDRAVTVPGKSEDSGTNMETAELRTGLGAGLRIMAPQLEERSVIKRWVLPSLSPPVACWHWECWAAVPFIPTTPIS